MTWIYKQWITCTTLTTKQREIGREKKTRSRNKRDIDIDIEIERRQRHGYINCGLPVQL